jgi:hypothetical protein
VFLAASIVALAYASQPPDDKQLIERAPGQRPSETAAAPAAPPSTQPESCPDELAQAERQARVEANVALAKLELVLARKALRGGDLSEAAARAERVLGRLRDVPPQMDLSEIELQAEGILARAAQAGAKVERRFAESADRSASPTTARQPGRPIIDVDTILARDKQGVAYQDALREAYKGDEARMLVEAEETRLAPDGVVSYPSDWPERVAKRQKWAGGQIARSASWYDQDGREWYVAIYDIHDLIYVPPDFGIEAQFADDRFQLRNTLDRERFWDRGFGWGGYSPDETISLLRYFGGVNAWVDRGPKYSPEKQREVVEMIRAFTGARVEESGSLPPAPR